MKAVQLTQYAPEQNWKEAIALNDVEKPTLSEKELRIVVKAYSVASNPVDYKIGTGSLASFIKKTLPFTTGGDFAGVVEEIPAWVKTSLKVGDRVFGFMGLRTQPATGGSFAEFIDPLESQCFKIPDGMSFDEAAAIPLISATSYQVLTGPLCIKQGAGQKLLILGGSTATGLAAIQFAKELGCTEIAVTSSSVDLCKSFGATTVINYREGKEWFTELAGKDFDAVYDCIGGPEAFGQAKKVLKPKGARFTTIAGDNPGAKLTAGALFSLVGKTTWRNTVALFGSPTWSFFSALVSEGDKSGMPYFISLYQKGVFKIPVDPSSPYEFSADGCAKMFEQQASGRSKGKLIMRIRNE